MTKKVLYTATVDHGCVLSDFVHLRPGVNLGSQVSVGVKGWLGVGATVINNININGEVLVGAGGVAVRDLAQLTIYSGALDVSMGRIL